MNKPYFRAAIITQGVGGNIVLNVGYPPVATPPSTSYLAIPEAITSENTAIARGMSFLRRFQSNGFDCRLEVLAVVVDDNAFPVLWDTTVFVASGKALPTTPIRAMLPAEQTEQMYARIDTEEKGLKTRVSLSNRSATSNALLGNLGGDYLEDTNDKSTLLLETI